VRGRGVGLVGPLADQTLNLSAIHVTFSPKH
jgi:hypothetical protein